MTVTLIFVENRTEIKRWRLDGPVIPCAGDHVHLPGDGSRLVRARKMRFYNSETVHVELEVGPREDGIDEAESRPAEVWS